MNFNINRRLISWLSVGVISCTIYSCVKHSFVSDVDPNGQYADALDNQGYLKNSINPQNTVTLTITQSSGGVRTIDIDSIGLSFQTTKALSSGVTAILSVDSTLVSQYNSTNQTSYKVVPSNAYRFIGGTTITLQNGKPASNAIQLAISDFSAFTVGNTYLLPVTLSNISDNQVQLNSNFKTMYIIVSVVNSGTLPSTAKPGGVKSVLYVEVNNNNPLNAGSYVLKQSGVQLFDIVNIFAANINYDDSQQKAVLYFNQQVNAILSNSQKYIAPLQKKGIKVVLSVLGNHAGVGVSNFTSEEAINDFALQLKQTVIDYHLDGIDLDDEYADYGNNNQPRDNDSSTVLLVKRLREIMPDKLITVYNIGDITYRNSWNGINAADYIDYAWNPYYYSYNAPVFTGLTDKKKLGAAAIQIYTTSWSFFGPQYLTPYATRTLSDGYGVYLWYDLAQQDVSQFLSYATTVLYNDSTVVNGPLYPKDY